MGSWPSAVHSFCIPSRVIRIGSKEHPAIERKLSEFVNRHGMRQARYRGRAKVLWQALMTGLVVNLKRMVRLLAAAPPPFSGGTVRAEAVGLS
jgi:hypothetical protein